MCETYITTSIPYVNAEPHVGFALELVQADVIARINRLLGKRVVFQTGTDENAIKNVLAAEKLGIAPQNLVNQNASRFYSLIKALNCSTDTFIRTTESRHHRGVQALWHRLSPNDLYKKSYHGLYCSACEDFYRQTELSHGRCPEHGIAPSQVNEENYFFRLSSYQRQIEQLIVEEKIDIIPSKRRNEVLSFIRRGLRDISISRDARRSRGWGVPVPTDASQIIYVWIDALTNYLSGQGFGDGDGWRNVWNLDTKKIHVIGKNVWKFHAIYWPALLLSAKLPLPNVIVVNGFLTADGKKIGKSLGNSVNPFECLDQFGSDAVRYYLLRATPAFDDGDFSSNRLRGLYETELANGLGNLLSRLSALCERVGTTSFTPPASPPAPAGFVERLESYQFDRAAAIAWDGIGQLNRSIESVKPWALLQANQRLELRGHLHHWLNQLYCLGHWLQPLIPDASSKITDNLTQPNIRHAEPLFPRLR